ncbi:cupin domain-containing protein [Pseudomonas petrae]|uniref:Cupin domain-containing protein n=1 Tax=Pseudomonas petrae TaxID=2912190 RepID=A0ABS9IDF0_9PSED|nr:cupin domain-containing protein [Pseudomonas petrae]MCF7545429.1 cupin domain-containing protein [Pseudomonas petrae]
MSIRRLVVGNKNGQSVLLDDAPVPRQHDYQHIPGFSTALIWATSANPTLADGFNDPINEQTSFVPGPGESRLMIVSFPPDSIYATPDFDFAKAGTEQVEHLTGLAQAFDPEHPGMHVTSSIDYAILLEGSLSLELDNGEIRTLKPHDVVIQQGNVHAWRNSNDAPAIIVFILIGALRG